ncbi:MAG: hypothetical protein ACLPJH_00285 [Myxococcaceae bacterium]
MPRRGHQFGVPQSRPSAAEVMNMATLEERVEALRWVALRPRLEGGDVHRMPPVSPLAVFTKRGYRLQVDASFTPERYRWCAELWATLCTAEADGHLSHCSMRTLAGSFYSEHTKRLGPEKLPAQSLYTTTERNLQRLRAAGWLSWTTKYARAHRTYTLHGPRVCTEPMTAPAPVAEQAKAKAQLKDRSDRYCEPCKYRRRLDRWVDKYSDVIESMEEGQRKTRLHALLAEYDALRESSDDKVNCLHYTNGEEGPLCAHRMWDLLWGCVCIVEPEQHREYLRACKAFKQEPRLDEAGCHVWQDKKEAA